MKIKILFITFIGLINNSLFSQTATLNWAKQISSSADDYGRDLFIDVSNNVTTTGYLSSTVDLDPGSVINNCVGGYIAKYNTSGTYTWAFSLGLNCEPYAIKNAGSQFYLVGTYNAPTDFDPVGTATLSQGLSSTAGFIAKYSISGTYVWAKALAGTGSIFIQDINTFSNTDILVSGKFSGQIDFDPSVSNYLLTASNGNNGFIARYTSAGAFLWAKQITNAIGSGNSTLITASAIDNTDNIFVTGTLIGTADFDPGTGIANLSESGGIGSPDIFVGKYDGTGNYIWAQKIGSNSSIDISGDVITDASGNAYFSGRTGTTVDINPGSSVTNVTEGFLVKFNSSGTMVASIELPWYGSSTYTPKLTLSPAGNITQCMDIGTNTFDFNPGTPIVNLTGYAANCSYYATYSPSLSYISAMLIGSGSVISHVQGANGVLFTTGNFYNTIDFDPSATTQNLVGVSGDSFVAKYTICAAPPTVPLAIAGPTLLCASASGNYSVTVVSGATAYNWTLPSGWTGSSSTNTLSAIPGVSGNFTVVASNACGNSANKTLSVTVSPCTNINELNNESNFQIFPNPSSDNITVALNERLTNNSYIYIYNSLGQFLKCIPVTSTLIDVKLTDYQNGVYIIQIKSEDRIMTKKIIKQ